MVCVSSTRVTWLFRGRELLSKVTQRLNKVLTAYTFSILSAQKQHGGIYLCLGADHQRKKFVDKTVLYVYKKNEGWHYITVVSINLIDQTMKTN